MNLRFFSRHKWTISMGSAGVVKALIDNSWIFTEIPLPGQTYSDVAGKIFYLIAEAAVTGFLSAGVGRLLDLRNQAIGQQAEELLPIAMRSTV
jgi:hypothetical protein